MISKYIKIFILALVLMFSIPAFAKPNYSYTINQAPIQAPNSTQGAYVNEEITIPITQVGFSEKYTKPEIVEQGLEIVWNEWHARVRNQMFYKNLKHVSSPDNYIIHLFYTVDINKNISNIEFVYIPESSTSKINNLCYLKQNSVFYIYLYDSNKFYQLQHTEPPVRTAIEGIVGVINKATKKEISYRQVPYWRTFPKMGKKVKKFSGNYNLTFPEKTKRTSVAVKLGYTDIDYLKEGEYTASDFDDVEKL